MLKNQFEKKIDRQLKRAKAQYKYESEKIPYILARHYVPDFVVTLPTGKVYIELKGYLRVEDRSKLIAVKKLHPTMDLRIVFYSENKKYIKWAMKNRIPYAIGSIPKEWLDVSDVKRVHAGVLPNAS